MRIKKIQCAQKQKSHVRNDTAPVELLPYRAVFSEVRTLAPTVAAAVALAVALLGLGRASQDR